MTIEQVQTLTGQEFEFYATSVEDGSVVFCLPIPNSMFSYWTDENGSLILPGNPVEAAQYLAGIWMTYLDDFAPAKSEYRTKAKAGNTDPLPQSIPSITLFPYQNSMTFRNKPDAHLVMMGENITKELEYKDNKLFYRGMAISEIDSDGQIYSDGMTIGSSQQELPMSDTDLQTLRFLYGIILEKYSKNMEEIIRKVGEDPDQFLSHSVSIYMPDYLRAIGLPININRDNILRIVHKISDYSKYIGVLQSGRSKTKIYYAYRPVIVGLGYDETTNKLTFASPYMNDIITRVLQASIELDKHGEPKRSRNGKLLTKPTHSHRVQRSILKERNVRAREIVHIICDLIDETGNHGTPNISFRTIIEDKFPQLKADLDALSNTYNRNRLLHTTFSAAWRYLPKHTDLLTVYKNIQLPDPKNPASIPTMKTLDDVIRFPHEGRIKNNSLQTQK